MTNNVSALIENTAKSAKKQRYVLTGLLLLVIAELNVLAFTFNNPVVPLRLKEGPIAVAGYFNGLITSCNQLLIGIIVILFFTYRHYSAAIFSPHSARSRYIGAQLMLVCSVYLCLAKIIQSTGGLPNGEATLLVVALYALALPTLPATLLMFAPLSLWQRFFYEQKGWLITLFSGIVLYRIIFKLVKAYNNQLAKLMFQPTTQVAAYIDRALGYQVFINPPSKSFGVGGFDVSISTQCLGYEGIGLILLFLSGYLFCARKHLKFPAVLLVIVFALLAIWLLNAVRIALLMAIGASWSADIALNGFHSAAGWWNLMCVALLSVWVINRFSLFTRQPVDRLIHLDSDNIFLAPQLALLAVSLGSLLFTARFDWLYPLRVIIVGALLVHFRRALQLHSVRPGVIAAGIGALIFLIWIIMVPPVATQSEAFAASLFAQPWPMAVGWMAFRIAGAAVIVPFAEELAFRGFLLTYVEHRLGGFSPRARQTGATLISSLAFGALHGAWLAGTLAGIGFAAAKQYRGRLSDAIVAHMSANLLLCAYVISSGQWSYW